MAVKNRYSAPNCGYLIAVIIIGLILSAPIFIVPPQMLRPGALLLLGITIIFLVIGGLSIRQYTIKGNILTCRFLFGLFSKRHNLTQFYKYTTRIHYARAPGVRYFADVSSLFSKTNMLRFHTVKLHSWNSRTLLIEEKCFAKKGEYDDIVKQIKYIVKNNGNIRL